MTNHLPRNPIGKIRSGVTLLLAMSTLLAFDAPLEAQKKKKSKYKPEYWQTDPYTKKDPARMKKAGYVSFGPFPWGDDHTSDDIKRMFPTQRMVFVETAHFRIGSALPEYSLPRTAKLEKKILKKELKRLKALFPGIKPTQRKLDPWLRLHLFAMRLEDTYADFSKRIEVEDKDFPQVQQGVRVSRIGELPKRFDKKPEDRSEDYMGQGPILGMRSKFLILLLVKGGDLDRYAARAWNARPVAGDSMPLRHYFRKAGSLFFGTTCECAKKALFNDHALHCHVVFNAIQSLMDGYKDFFFSLPVWSREGLSHYYLRKIDPKEHCFTGMKGRSALQRYESNWDVKIKRRVKFDDFTPAAEIMKLTSFHDLTFRDHMAVWSRMDFLQSLGSKKFARFMSILKGKIEVAAGQIPPNDLVFAQQERALKTAYGFDYAGFDAAWKAYVRKVYPNK